jgi:hypothetical protein
MCRDGKQAICQCGTPEAEAAGDGEQQRSAPEDQQVETPPAYILTSYEKYIPPPCISQAPREEALEVSSANGRSAPEISSAQRVLASGGHIVGITRCPRGR